MSAQFGLLAEQSGPAPASQFGLASQLGLSGQAGAGPSLVPSPQQQFGLAGEIGGSGDVPRLQQQQQQQPANLPPRQAYPDLGPGSTLQPAPLVDTGLAHTRDQQPTLRGVLPEHAAHKAQGVFMQQQFQQQPPPAQHWQQQQLPRQPQWQKQQQHFGFPQPPPSPKASMPLQQQQQQQQQQSGRASIATPVVDSSRLARYGLLAPPAYVPPASSDRPVQYDRNAGVMAHNRGALREAVAQKTGHIEDAPVRKWAEFTARQRARHVPVPPDGQRRMLPATQGYRLRILRVNDLPMHTTHDGRSYEFQLGVSLYDEAYGTFYGNTVYTCGDGYDRSLAAQRNAIDLDFSYDVFWHTRISDPRCMAVVEVIMLERMLDGVIKGRYSLGWALLPLFQMGGTTGTPQALPMVSGTPRYLLMRSVFNETLRAPKVLQNCSVVFQAEAYSTLGPIIPLLPEDFLVSYGDVIPGLRRFDGAGQLSITAKQCISTLARPIMSPTFSLVLRRLQMALPMKLHELLAQLDYKMDAGQAEGLNRGAHTGGLKYSIRVSLHNGRTFVGPCYNLQHISAMDVPGWKVLQVLMPDAVFDYVMGDVLTTVVVELMAVPPQFLPQGAEPSQRLVGWTAFVPFTFISGDGCQAEVAVGVHRYALTEPKAGLLLRDAPPLNWRNLLGDRAAHDLPPPMVEFQLFETGRGTMPPPQEPQVAVIEQQRVQETIPVPDTARHFDQGPSPPPMLSPRLPSGDAPRYIYDPRQSLSELPPSMQRQGQPSPALQQLTQSTVMDRDHGLDQVTAAMQQQLHQLTRAVEELREERKSLRDSLAFTSQQPIVVSPARQPAGAAGMAPTPDELQRFRDLPATDQFGHAHAFAGASAPSGHEQGEMSGPSRKLMQQLHDAGMVDALPDDVQAMLRMHGGTRQPGSLPVDLSIEARDPRTASDVVLQVLSYRHHDTLNAPANLQSLYFTFQFYHFPPTTTEMAFLVQPKPTTSAPVTMGRDGVFPPAAATPAAADATRILVTNNPTKRGAGVVVKHMVDGSSGLLSPGQSPSSAAYEAHMAFVSFLASHSLSVDVWDGDSLLQVGTASLDLAPLLRQGREFAEVLVELPIMLQDSHQEMQQHQRAASMGATPGAAEVPTILSRGSVVVRAINIGRQPSNSASQPQMPFDAAGATAAGHKRTRLRAHLAWQDCHSAIARELGNGEYEALMQGGGDDQARALALHNIIMANSTRKCARIRQLRDITDTEKGRVVVSRGSSNDQYRRMQQQMLVDLSGARSRNKQAFIREQLRRSMVSRQVVKPGYGEVVVYEHPFVNPYSQEMVFELRISSPSEVSVLSRGDEYRGLRAANATFLGSSGDRADVEPELMGGNRLYMRAGERVRLPLKIQSLQPPKGYGPQAAPAGVVQHSAPGPQQHVVSVDFVSATHGYSVGVVELQIEPRPLIIDRTFRFYHPERELMRQTISLSHLPGGGGAFSGGAARQLAVAASHPDVITGAGSSGLAGGPGTRDEVYVKYKCGAAPEVCHFYVVLYADRLLARPVEVWQVFVNSLRKVDMRAMIGQCSTASVVVRGAMVSRRVAAYASHPDELQVSPDSFVLVAGALTEVLVCFKPITAGPKDIKVHLVDVETQELVYALIVAAEAQGPLVTRTFEMEILVGAVANKKISYTNPYPAFRTFTLRSNQPWLLQFTPPKLQLPGGATRPLGLTFDARAATTGILDTLVFVNDEEERTEECFKIRVRIYR